MTTPETPVEESAPVVPEPAAEPAPVEAPVAPEPEPALNTVTESVPPDTEKVEPSTDVAGEFNADPAHGYFGVQIDPTPNENYSVAGVISGAPTPETDPEHAAAVRAQVVNTGR